MRAILVNADRSPSTGARLEFALDLARIRDGHLTVLLDTPVTRYIAMDPLGGSHVMSDALAKARLEDDEAADRIEARLARDDVPFDILRAEADPVSALAQAALLADLTIVSRKEGGALAGDLALASRTPVLVLPENRVPALPLAKACVAWDGGEQATAALKAALPLLASAETVTVITVAEKAGGYPATDALSYLSRNGIHAELEEHVRRGSIEETLGIAVTQAGADLLVMGAYGKSWMRELLFGGVTAHFLSDSQAPALLLAH
ncbi:universal stress protein [Novosphingobium sp. 9]|uniref:universal stress protein n=1 Tax=Novosphingobium sp. 9 TaxID=2025349 RepID=UPI0021B55E90|nr:universal stress protein [Novosphingobium sp. 9]